MGVFDQIASILGFGEGEPRLLLPDLDRAIEETRSAYAEALAVERRTAADLAAARAELDALGERAAAAVCRGDDGDARRALLDRRPVEERIHGLEEAAKVARVSLAAFGEKLTKLKARREVEVKRLSGAATAAPSPSPSSSPALPSPAEAPPGEAEGHIDDEIARAEELLRVDEDLRTLKERLGTA